MSPIKFILIGDDYVNTGAIESITVKSDGCVVRTRNGKVYHSHHSADYLAQLIGQTTRYTEIGLRGGRR